MSRKFVEVSGWNHQKQEPFPMTINLDALSRITANDEGRAVLHFADAAIVLMCDYRDFIATGGVIIPAA
jgi:hypothetical protein